MATADKDFKVKNGLVVGAGGTFNGTVVVATPTENTHAATKAYVDAVGGGVNVSDTTPEDPIAGMLWFDSTTARFFIYYDSFWIEVSSSTGTGGSTISPFLLMGA